jgi:hypothetical protein
MQRVVIHQPIWKTRSIGIAEHRIVDDLIVEIDYRTKDGQLLYPHTYFIARAAAMRYPVQEMRGLRLRIIPIDDLVVRDIRDSE